MEEKQEIDSLLFKGIISDDKRITYELKLLDNTKEEINISYLKNESRYTDDGYTLYELSSIQNSESKKGLSQAKRHDLEQIAAKFGVSLIEDELTIIKGDDSSKGDHYELANLVNCIISINALSRFTTIFEN